MTPEQKAKALVRTRWTASSPPGDWEDLMERIASALRQARDEALEEAARLCEVQEYYPDTVTGERQRWVLNQVAWKCRALKSAPAPTTSDPLIAPEISSSATESSKGRPEASSSKSPSDQSGNPPAPSEVTHVGRYDPTSWCNVHGNYLVPECDPCAAMLRYRPRVDAVDTLPGHGDETEKRRHEPIHCACPECGAYAYFGRAAPEVCPFCNAPHRRGAHR